MVKAVTILVLFWVSPVSLEKYTKQNDMVLVEFWATWCPACVESLPKTLAIARAYPKAKFLLIAVSDNEHDIRQFFKTRRVPKNVLICTWRGKMPVKFIPRFWVYYKGKKIMEAQSMDEVKKKLITDFGPEIRGALK